MSEKTPHTPTLHNETTRDSGLVVPGVYSENPIEATVILPTTQEVSHYGKTNEATLSDEQKTEQLYELHRKAYQDILDPRHVIELKDEIEVALSRVGTRSQNVNTGLDVNKEKQSARAKIIEEYLHIGDPDKTRPISDDLRKSLDTLLAQPIKALEKKIKEASKEGVDVSTVDNPVETSTPEDLETKESRVEEARAEVEDALEINEDIEPKDEHTEEDLDDAEDKVVVDEGEEDGTTSSSPASESHRRTVEPEILEKINQADKILSPKKRAQALSRLAKEYGSIEAAERITSLTGLTNPWRYVRFFTGTDRSAHDRALGDIIESSGKVSQNDRLEAALKMYRGNARNKALYTILSHNIVEDPNLVMKISREMHGPSRAKFRRRLIAEAARQLDDPAAAVRELRLDGPLSRHIKPLLEEKVSKDKLKKFYALIDKLPSRRRDKVLSEIAIESRNIALLSKIKSPFIRNKTRQKILN